MIHDSAGLSQVSPSGRTRRRGNSLLRGGVVTGYNLSSAEEDRRDPAA